MEGKEQTIQSTPQVPSPTNLNQEQKPVPPKQKRKVKTPYIIFGLIFLILILFASYYMLLSKNDAGSKQSQSNQQTNPSVPPQKPIIEKGVNEIEVIGVMPSPNVVRLQKVNITNPGFVLIRRDNHGAPDEIIGISGYLPAGVSNNVDVTLTGDVTDGEILYAMVYSDNTADGEFTFPGDEPAKDPDGNLALYSFFAGGSAPEDDSMTVSQETVSQPTEESTTATESGM